MALDFENGSSEYAEATTAVVSGVPCSMAAWIKAESLHSGCVVSVATSGSDNNYLMLFVRNTGAVEFHNRATDSDTGISSATYSAGSWMHVSGSSVSSGDSQCFVNGANKGTAASNNAPSGMNRSSVGRIPRAGSNLYFDGLIAEVGIWDAVLDDAEHAVLAKGVSPLKVRPQSLVAYWPLWGSYTSPVDLVSGISLTKTGTVAADHPRVLYPSRSQRIYIPGGGGGGDPEGSLIGGKLIRGGLLLHGVLGR